MGKKNVYLVHLQYHRFLHSSADGNFAILLASEADLLLSQEEKQCS